MVLVNEISVIMTEYPISYTKDLAYIFLRFINQNTDCYVIHL